MASLAPVIRSFQAADIEECIAVGLDASVSVHASLEKQYGADLFGRLRPNWREAQAQAIEHLCGADNKQRLVIDSGSSILGFIVATPDYETGLASIEFVAVRPSEQQAGWGTALIRESVAGLRQAGMIYVQAYLRDFPGHRPARVAFGKAGFHSMPMQPMPLYVRLDQSAPISAVPTQVRRIRKAEVADCVRFGVESFRPIFASFRDQHCEDVFRRMFPDWEKSQAQHIESVCSSAEKETWVYEAPGGVAGFVVLGTDDQSLGEIELLAVDPQAHGSGIGTALNRHALNRLRELGMAYAIVATADDPGHEPARRSYGNVGFAPMPVQWDFVISKLQFRPGRQAQPAAGPVPGG